MFPWFPELLGHRAWLSGCQQWRCWKALARPATHAVLRRAALRPQVGVLHGMVATSIAAVAAVAAPASQVRRLGTYCRWYSYFFEMPPRS